jgi:hypothetical protein
MGVREALNKSKATVTVVAVVIILGAALAIFLQTRGSFAAPGPGEAYYTTDDGKTLFTDKSGRITPFDKDGKPAYRAHVFNCGGTQVVGYLSRYTEETKQALEWVKANPGKQPADVGLLAGVSTTGTELKKPGAPNWVSAADSMKATQIRAFRCPDGSSPSESIVP